MCWAGRHGEDAVSGGSTGRREEGQVPGHEVTCQPRRPAAARPGGWAQGCGLVTCGVPPPSLLGLQPLPRTYWWRMESPARGPLDGAPDRRGLLP